MLRFIVGRDEHKIEESQMVAQPRQRGVGAAGPELHAGQRPQPLMRLLERHAGGISGQPPLKAIEADILHPLFGRYRLQQRQEPLRALQRSQADLQHAAGNGGLHLTVD